MSNQDDSAAMVQNVWTGTVSHKHKRCMTAGDTEVGASPTENAPDCSECNQPINPTED